MSSKLVRQQLNSVLHRSIDKQQQQQKAQQGGSSKKGKNGKRSKKQHGKLQGGEAAEERQTQVLAANLKYFSKTTAAKGGSQDLIAQLLAKQGFQPRPSKQSAQQPLKEEESEDDLEGFADLF